MVTPPGCRSFFAAIIEDEAGQGYVVTTRRSRNVWMPDTSINVADLVMPEIDLNEWDVELLQFARFMEQAKGGPLTPQELWLAIDQARAMGELHDPTRLV